MPRANRGHILGAIDPAAWLSQFRKPTRRPTDVLNVIDYRDFGAYRTYAALVLPTVYACGGRPVWGGRWKQSIAGERWCGSLTVMRYPSHRIWMLMVTNPYYAIINGYRDRGVERFQAAFTDPFVPGDQASGMMRAIGVHFDAPDAPLATDRISAELGRFGLDLRYASVSYMPIEFVAKTKPNDPHPLQHRVTALYAVRDRAQLDRAIDSGVFAELHREHERSSIQLYERASFRDYVPFGPLPADH